MKSSPTNKHIEEVLNGMDAVSNGTLQALYPETDNALKAYFRTKLQEVVEARDREIIALIDAEPKGGDNFAGQGYEMAKRHIKESIALLTPSKQEKGCCCRSCAFAGADGVYCDNRFCHCHQQ